MQIQKNYLWLWRHEPPYDTYSKVVINRDKCDVNTLGSFGGIKTDTQTELRFIYLFFDYEAVTHISRRLNVVK